jgi:DNA-binding HxlR family transcriptional regulator
MSQRSEESSWGIKELEQIFHSLGNEHRLEILKELDRHSKPRSFTELKTKLDLNSRTLSFHLRVLIDAKLINRRLEENESGHYAMYALTDKGQQVLEKYKIYA